MEMHYRLFPPNSRAARDSVGFRTIGAVPSLVPGAYILAAIGDQPSRRLRIDELETVVTNHSGSGYVADTVVVRIFTSATDAPAIFHKSPDPN
jgi:hypothetical protein